MNESLLSLDHVDKSFGGLRVIHDVSFSVIKGSRTALIGPNGAGKTTLFNLISGVYDLDQGSIHLDGHDISQVPSPARCRYGLSRSFQNIRLMPHLSTLENVMLGQHSQSIKLWQDNSSRLASAAIDLSKRRKQALHTGRARNLPGSDCR